MFTMTGTSTRCRPTSNTFAIEMTAVSAIAAARHPPNP